MKYNYVFFNGKDSRLFYKDDGYYTICIKDLCKIEGVQVVNFPCENLCLPFRFLFWAHNSGLVNKIINLPYKQLWFPYYFSNTFKDNKPLCFILEDKELPHAYIKFLKVKYPNCKIVVIFRDLVNVGYKFAPWLKNTNLVDLTLSIDKEEAKAHEFLHFDEFESKIPITISKNYPIFDVFFAGKAKDRLPSLIKAYDILSHAGLKCYFYITNANKEIKRKGIVYSNKQLSYKEMLYYTVNSKCVLEINQIGAVGYTSRFLEAVMYNKLLVTNNLTIKDSKFYNPSYIQCIEKIEDINPQFITNNIVVDYKYKNEFSPIHLIEKIDNFL